MNISLMSRVAAIGRLLRDHENWNAGVLFAHQEEQLRLLRMHAVTASPFYRRFHEGLAGASYTHLPVLTKALLISDLGPSDWRGESPDRYRIARTSGSTGRSATVYRDDEEWAWILASYGRAMRWAGMAGRLGRRLAVVSSQASWHHSALVGESVDNRFFPVKRFDAMNPLPDVVRGLNAWQPDRLITYPSMLRTLTREQEAGRLGIAPAAIMSIAEVLSAATRARARDTWQLDPFDLYATTETGCLASECSLRRLHLFEDLVLADFVNDAGELVPADTEGASLVVSVLFSRTQPLIRYKIGDRVTLSPEPCPCGLPFRCVTTIEGRNEDALVVPGRAGEAVTIHPSVFHGLLGALATDGYQIVRERGALRVLLVRPAGNVDAAQVAAMLNRVLMEHGATALNLTVECVTAALRTATGKVPLIVDDTRAMS